MGNKNFLVTFGLILSSYVLTSSGLPADFCVGTGSVEFLPHPDSCIKYVLCVLGSPTVLDCEPNHVYSEANNRCEPGNPDTCELFDVTTTTTSEAPPVTTTTTTWTDPPTTTTTLTDPPTTTTTLTDPPTTTTTLTDPPTTTTTLTDPPTTTTTLTDPPTTTTTLTDPPTTTTTLTDPPTTSTTLTDPPTTTTTTFTAAPTTSTTTESGPEITTPPPTTSTQRPIGPPELCVGNNFRFVADPDYCFRFYYCLFGVALPGECDPDRIFSERWRGCVLGDQDTCVEDNPVVIVTSVMPWI